MMGQLPSQTLTAPMHPLIHPREYPVTFGFKLVDMFPDMVSTPRGRAPLPDPLPGAMASFLEMEEVSNSMQFAHIEAVYSYLRRNRHLKIPNHWKHLVPGPF